MKSSDVQQLTLRALLIALVASLTMLIQIPIPFTQGYAHLGDSMILLAAVFFKRKDATIAAAFGSSIADILTGYTHWALFTLVIKGLMAYGAATVIQHYEGERPTHSLRLVAAVLTCEGIMILGYFLGGIVLQGSVLASLSSVPGNLLQAGMGTFLFYVVAIGFEKIKLPAVVARQSK